MSRQDETSRLPLGMIILFALPALVSGFMHGPEAQLQGVYAKYAGLTLTALAGVTLLTRAFDAITYPVIGYLSDLGFARFGTRKPWVVGGAVMSAFGVWFLYRPPAGVGIVYYGIWTAITYLGWKIAEIPNQAWSFGLTRDYQDRAKIQGFRVFATMFGGMLFFAMPDLVKALGWSANAELNFPALNLTAIICAVAVPLVAIVVIWRIPEGEATQPSPSERRHYGVMEALRAIAGNRPLIHFLVAMTPFAVFGGLGAGVSYLFIDVYLGLGDVYPTIMLITIPMGLLGIPLWSYLAMRFERHRVMAFCTTVGGLAYLGLSLVPTGVASAPVVMVLYPITMLAVSGLVILAPMIGDISDYGRLQTGSDLTGLYTAVFGFVQVSLRTVTTAIGIASIGWLGFDATATTQTAMGGFGIRLIAVILPAIGTLLAAVLFWTFPLTRKRVAEVHAALSEREAQQAAELGLISPDTFSRGEGLSPE